MSFDSKIFDRLVAKLARGEKLSQVDKMNLEYIWKNHPQYQEVAKHFDNRDWVPLALKQLDQTPKDELIRMGLRLKEMRAQPPGDGAVHANESGGKPAAGQVVSRRGNWIIGKGMAAVIIVFFVLALAVQWVISRPPEGCAIKNAQMIMVHASLDDLLDKIADYYGAKIYNPTHLHIPGTASGQFPLSIGIASAIGVVVKNEEGDTFISLRYDYKKGIIYVCEDTNLEDCIPEEDSDEKANL